MKKKIIIAALIGVLVSGGIPAGTYASEANPDQGIVDQIKEQLSDAFENMDQEMADQVFDFLKDQVKEGNLSSGTGIRETIEKGQEKFGVEISEADAKTLVNTMEKLEGMGFSAEYVVEKAGSLYEEYGTDFVEHTDELVKGAVKNAASNTINSFWKNLKSSVKNFFTNLF